MLFDLFPVVEILHNVCAICECEFALDASVTSEYVVIAFVWNCYLRGRGCVINGSW